MSSRSCWIPAITVMAGVAFIGCGPSPYDNAGTPVAQNDGRNDAPAAEPAVQPAAPSGGAADGNSFSVPMTSQPYEPGPGEAAPDQAAAPDSAPPASAPSAPSGGDPAASGGDVQSSAPARAGSGRQGDSLDTINDPVGKVIAEPARAYFRLREKAVFEIAIPKALELYYALNGRKPADHEAFLRDIIEANRIQLPELHPNQRYRFDPTRGQYGELMVDTLR